MDSVRTAEQQIAAEVANRRRYSRYQIDVALRVTVRSGDLVKAVHGRGSDVGQGGLAAHIAVELQEGDVVELEITLPYSSEPLVVNATVRNRESYCYGMEFLNITDAQSSALDRCCRSLALTQ
jgi:c-di-GMP-binding flagellar brake protein YcgR